MANPDFTTDEIAAFETWISSTDQWRGFSRDRGRNGEDVLEIQPDRNRFMALRVAKTDMGYAATGFDGWGLTVCDDFEELLGILSSWRPRPCAAADRAA